MGTATEAHSAGDALPGRAPGQGADLYSVLGLSPRASREQVERAYRFCLELYGEGSVATYSLLEPDEAEQQRIRVREAYQVLVDADQRRTYDEGRGFVPPDSPVLPFPTPPRAGPAAELPAVLTGADLRRIREARGMSLRHIAAVTKIGVRYLEYVEEDRFALLPAPVYLRGLPPGVRAAGRGGPASARPTPTWAGYRRRPSPRASPRAGAGRGRAGRAGRVARRAPRLPPRGRWRSAGCRRGPRSPRAARGAPRRWCSTELEIMHPSITWRPQARAVWIMRTASRSATRLVQLHVDPVAGADQARDGRRAQAGLVREDGDGRALAHPGRLLQHRRRHRLLHELDALGRQPLDLADRASPCPSTPRLRPRGAACR